MWMRKGEDEAEIQQNVAVPGWKAYGWYLIRFYSMVTAFDVRTKLQCSNEVDRKKKDKLLKTMISSIRKSNEQEDEFRYQSACAWGDGY